MSENERQLAEMRQTYEEKLRQQELEARKEEQKAKSEHVEKKEDVEELKRHHPYLSNLNFDEQLSGKITHIIKAGVNSIGNERT